MKKRYFITFTEEFWAAGSDFCGVGKIREDIDDFIMGRIEVYDKKSKNPYADTEIRFFSRDKEGFYEFRKKWDFKDIDERELTRLKKIAKLQFNEKD